MGGEVGVGGYIICWLQLPEDSLILYYQDSLFFGSRVFWIS